MKNKTRLNIFTVGFIVILLVGLLCLSRVRAFEFDNVKSYDSELKQVTITNAFGLGSDIAQVKLDSELIEYVPVGKDVKVAEFTINSIAASDSPIEGFRFYDLDTGKEVSRPYVLKYKIIQQVDVPDKELSCETYQKIENDTSPGQSVNRCIEVNSGTTHSEEKEQWNVYDKDSAIKEGEKVTLGVFVNTAENENIEWIPTLYGNQINEWAQWKTFSFDVDLQAGWAFNSTTAILDEEGGRYNLSAAAIALGNKTLAPDIFRESNQAIWKTSSETIKNSTVVANLLNWNEGTWYLRTNVTNYTASSADIILFFFQGTGVTFDNNTELAIDAGSNNFSFKYFRDNNVETDLITPISFSNPSNKNKWFQFFLTWNTTGTYVYSDSQLLVFSTALKIRPGIVGRFNYLGVGYSSTESNAEVFDEARIYNRTLTLTEIQTISNYFIKYIFTSLNYPQNSAHTILQTVTFNASASPVGVNLTNATIYLYNSSNSLINNSVNSSFTLSNETFFTVTGLSNDVYTWNVYICGLNATSNTICEFSNLNSTFTVESVVENAQVFNSSTYETAQENFLLNFSYDSTAFLGATAALVYDGTSYTSTRIGTGNEAIFSKSIDIPTIAAQINKSFYWAIGLTNTTGTSYFNTTARNQTVNNISLQYCLANTGLPYINFTFKDETTGSFINATNDLADFTYWLGGGNYTKEYVTSNTTDHFSYAYCFSNNNTLNVNVDYKYSKTLYPLRTLLLDNVVLTNITTNKTLYLLSSSDGIYSSIQTVTAAGVPLSGVAITAERQFAGVWTIVEQGITDSSGLVTFWVNPSYDHRITATASGYATVQVTIRPSQSIYTLKMSATEENASYVSDIEGLYWNFLPSSGRISRGSHNFNSTVYSYTSNLVGCRIDIVNQSSMAILTSSTSLALNSSYCTVNLDYVVQDGDRLFGRLAIDTTESAGYVYVDADWKWIELDLNASTWTTVTSFFEDLTDLSEFGSGNEAEYSRFMFFFLLSTILFGVFMFFSGVEFSSPGITIFLLWAFIFLASAGGFFTVDMGGSGSTVDSWFEKWGIFFTLTLFVLGFAVNSLRRYGE